MCRAGNAASGDTMSMKSTYTVPVEFGDTDPAAIVFYPNFFRWYDASAWHLFIQAGLTLDVMRKDFDLIGVPIVDARSRFITPAHFGDRLDITSFVSTWKSRAFEVTHEVSRGNELCAEGVEVRVCARRPDGPDNEIKAIKIPEEFKKRLSA